MKKLLTTISTITLSLSLLLTPILTTPTLASEASLNPNQQISQQSLLSTTSIKPTKVTLNCKTITLNTSSTTTLIPTISPSNATNQSVTWKSSNTKIATINSEGLITGIKAGKATITATTVDGKKTAKCIVTVKTAPIPTITSIATVSVTTTAGTAPILPNQVVATMSNRTTKNVNVTWVTPLTSQYDSVGTFTVSGRIAESTTIKAIANVTVVNPEPTIQDTQRLVLGKWMTDTKRTSFEFFNDGTVEHIYYLPNFEPSLKYESNYTFSSPTRIKIQEIRYYNYTFSEWTNTSTIITSDIVVDNTKLKFVRWNSNGDLVLNRLQ